MDILTKMAKFYIDRMRYSTESIYNEYLLTECCNDNLDNANEILTTFENFNLIPLNILKTVAEGRY